MTFSNFFDIKPEVEKCKQDLGRCMGMMMYHISLITNSDGKLPALFISVLQITPMHTHLPLPTSSLPSLAELLLLFGTLK